MAEGTLNDQASASQPGHVLWFQAGLRKAKWRLWVRLQELGETTAPELAAALDVRPSTARRHLRELADLGFVIHVGNHRWQAVVDPAVLAAAAEKLGVAGQLDRLQARHDRQRRDFRRTVQGWRTYRGPAAGRREKSS